MNSIWTNRTLWRRIAAIASALWVLGVIIVSANAQNFDWFGIYKNKLGPAFITASVGVLVILVVCLGIPWIAGALSPPKGKR